MSHCTSFKFQYTDRKLITQTFSNLGLRYEDSVVYSYDSGYAKSLGIASEERPAIVAESNGFNYFMEDFGNHYELSVEKHNILGLFGRSYRYCKIVVRQWSRNRKRTPARKHGINCC